MKDRASCGVAICNQKKPFCVPLSPDTPSDTDGTCTKLSSTLSADSSDLSLPSIKRRKQCRLVLRKPKCVSPSANGQISRSLCVDDSLPDLSIFDAEDSNCSSEATDTKQLIGSIKCKMVLNTGDRPRAGYITLCDTKIINAAGKSCTSSDDKSCTDVLMISSSTSPSSSGDDTVMSGISENTNKIPCPGRAVQPDDIVISECTCSENPWLCDSCVAELNNGKTTALCKDTAVNATGQNLSIGASVSSFSVEQEGFCNETSGLNKTFVAQIENSKTEAVSKYSAIMTDPTREGHPTLMNTPVSSDDGVCQSKFCYVVKSISDTGVVLSKKLLQPAYPAEQRCTCRDRKGLCPPCTAKLDKSWTISKHSASITKPAGIDGIDSVTTLPDVGNIKQECSCDVTTANGNCPVSVAKVDKSKTEDASKHPTSGANTTTKKASSGISWPDVHTVKEVCTCDKTTGVNLKVAKVTKSATMDDHSATVGMPVELNTLHRVKGFMVLR